MSANRVKETTATTGSGSFTTTGSFDNFQTFYEAYGTFRRFTFFAINDTDEQWEQAVGYLSDSTTLVRETIQSSSNSGSVVTFTTAPILFVDISSTGYVTSFGVIPTNTLVSSAHLTGNVSDFTMTADRAYYMPFLYNVANDFDSMVALIDSVGTANKIRLGLYENNKARPGKLIIQTGDIVPSAETFDETTVTQTKINSGWYFIAMIANGSMNSRKPEFWGTLSPLGVRDGQSFAGHYAHCYEDISSWTALPATAGSVTLVNSEGPKILLRVV